MAELQATFVTIAGRPRGTQAGGRQSTRMIDGPPQRAWMTEECVLLRTNGETATREIPAGVAKTNRGRTCGHRLLRLCLALAGTLRLEAVAAASRGWAARIGIDLEAMRAPCKVETTGAPVAAVAMMMTLGGRGRMIAAMAALANRDTGATAIVMTWRGVMTAVTVVETPMPIAMTPVGGTVGTATGIGTAKISLAIAAATIGRTTVASVSVRASVTEVAIATESGIGSEMIVIGMSAIEAVVLMTELVREGRESV